MDNNTITIPNIQDYTQQIVDGSLVLRRRIPIVDEGTLFKKNVLGSKIQECKINNIIYDVKGKYKKLLMHLYSDTDRNTILQNTTLNVSEQPQHDKGFKYYNHLHLSIQNAEARRTLKEIINITKIKNVRLELTIKLENDELVCFIV